MHRPDDIHYAFEVTRVIQEPDRRIDTFGSTQFEFHLLTEPMDAVDQVRIRSGSITAEKPSILRPDPQADFEFEGFDSTQAAQFSEFLREIASRVAFLQYGFQFRKNNVREALVHDSIDEVTDRIVLEHRHNPLMAVIQGVEDAWEICLLKFTMEMVQKSHGINIFDLKRRGLF